MKAVAFFGSLVIVLAYAPACSGSHFATNARCDGRSGRPISTIEAVRALRSKGFVVFRDTTQPCTPRMSDQLANTFFTGPHKNIDQHRAIVRTQGQLYCEIDKRPAPAQMVDLRRIRTYRVRSGGVEVIMANLICQLYAPDNRRVLFRNRLIAAFRALRVTI